VLAHFKFTSQPGVTTSGGCNPLQRDFREAKLDGVALGQERYGGLPLPPRQPQRPWGGIAGPVKVRTRHMARRAGSERKRGDGGSTCDPT